MSDEADIASREEERFRAQALRAATRKPRRPGKATCESCFETIPAARRKAMPSARRCVTCQEEIERMSRLFGRGF